MTEKHNFTYFSISFVSEPRTNIPEDEEEENLAGPVKFNKRKECLDVAKHNDTQDLENEYFNFASRDQIQKSS